MIVVQLSWIAAALLVRVLHLDMLTIGISIPQSSFRLVSRMGIVLIAEEGDVAGGIGLEDFSGTVSNISGGREQSSSESLLL